MRGFISHKYKHKHKEGIGGYRHSEHRDTLPAPSTKFELWLYGTWGQHAYEERKKERTNEQTMTIDRSEIPRTRSDGKKGNGKKGKHGKEKEVYSAKHVRLSLALSAASAIKNKNNNKDK